MLEQINWTFHVYFMLFFFVLGGVLFYRARKERKGWSRLAAKLGLIFQEKGSPRVDAIADRFLLTGASVVKQPTEILSGLLGGREMLAFNWFFQSEASLNAVRGGFACFVVTLNRERKRMHVFDKSLTEFVRISGETVMVLGSETFCERYTLFSSNRKAADAFFNDEVIQFLLSDQGLWLELSDQYLLLAVQGVWEPENFVAGLERCERLLALID